MTFDEVYVAFNAAAERVSGLQSDLARARNDRAELDKRIAKLERAVRSRQGDLSAAAHALKPELEKAVGSRLGRAFRFEDAEEAAE